MTPGRLAFAGALLIAGVALFPQDKGDDPGLWWKNSDSSAQSRIGSEDIASVITRWFGIFGQANLNAEQWYRDNSRFTAGLVLYKGKKYEEAIGVFRSVSADYHPIAVSLYIADSLERLGKRGEALDVLDKALSLPEGRYEKRSLLYPLFLSVALKEDARARMRRHEGPILKDLLGRKDDYALLMKYRLAEYYLGLAHAGSDRGDENAAVICYEKTLALCRSGFGKYSRGSVGGLGENDIIIFKEANLYWKNVPPRVRRDTVRFRYTILLCGASGKRDPGIGDRDVEKIRGGMVTVNKLVFYCSQGKLSLDFDFYPTRSAVNNSAMANREEKKRSAGDKEKTATGPAGPPFRQTDGFILVEPGNDSARSGGDDRSFTTCGTSSDPAFIPCLQPADAWKPGIILAAASCDSWKLFHGFFHTVELLYRMKTPFHAWNGASRKLWPSWYRGGGEFEYYRDAFASVVLIEGINHLMTRYQASGQAAMAHIFCR
jgi:tetratricopeptide (TPR) repeat protein